MLAYLIHTHVITSPTIFSVCLFFYEQELLSPSRRPGAVRYIDAVVHRRLNFIVELLCRIALQNFSHGPLLAYERLQYARGWQKCSQNEYIAVEVLEILLYQQAQYGVAKRGCMQAPCCDESSRKAGSTVSALYMLNKRSSLGGADVRTCSTSKTFILCSSALRHWQGIAFNMMLRNTNSAEYAIRYLLVP